MAHKNGFDSYENVHVTIKLSKERKWEQSERLNYHKKEKESNEGVLIIKGQKKRAVRDIELSKHVHTLSLFLTFTHHPVGRKGGS